MAVQSVTTKCYRGWGKRYKGLRREAAVGLTLGAGKSNPIGALFLDILMAFAVSRADVLLSRRLIENLGSQGERPWFSLRRGRETTERWLADRLREYDLRPRLLRVGEIVGRGYVFEDFRQAFKRYITESELEALRADCGIWEGPQDGRGSERRKISNRERRDRALSLGD